MAAVLVLGTISSVNGGTGPRSTSDTIGQPSAAPPTSDTSTTTVPLPDAIVESVPLALAPGWEDLGRLAIARHHATLVDIGPELIVFGGGDRPFTGPNEPEFEALWSGIRIDHASGAVRQMAPSPLCERGHPTAVWTGTELIVWGVVRSIPEGCPDAAAYAPASDTWRTLGSRFFRQAVQQAAWTGTEIVDVRGGVAYSLDTGTVRDVPSVRDSAMFAGLEASSPPQVHWTGKEFLVLGSEAIIRVDPYTNTLQEGPYPPLLRTGRRAAWAGGDLLAVDHELNAALFNAARGMWSAIDPVPLRVAECIPEPVAGAGLVLVGWCSGIGVWDGSGQWSALTNPSRSEGVSEDLAVGGGYLYQVGSRVVRRPLPEIDAQPRPLPAARGRSAGVPDG